MKFALVVDNDSTFHGVHADRVASSPSVLVKCISCSYHQSLTRTEHNGSRKRSTACDNSHILSSLGSEKKTEERSMKDKTKRDGGTDTDTQASGDVHTTTQRPKRAHMRVHAFKNTTKFHETTTQREKKDRKRPQREKKRTKLGAREREKQCEILGPPPFGPPPSRPHPWGPTQNRAEIGRA